MKLDEKHIAELRKLFNEIETVEDLLALINQTNVWLYKGTSKSLHIQRLYFHAFHAKNNYRKFKISKRSGGKRLIYAPNSGLKNILRTLNTILQYIYSPSKSAHGFIINKSVATNAEVHVGQNYIYNIDLSDFFPSIHQARVWRRLQLPPFNLNGKKIAIANLLACLCCCTNTMGKSILPQGAPTSPTISNFICERLDRRLRGLAKRFNLKYTRYADDITFSSMHNVYQPESLFEKELYKIIASQNFKVNKRKTRLQKSGYRKLVTGIVVNEKLNVSRKYIKELRKWLYYWKRYGEEKAVIFYIQSTYGEIAETKKVIVDLVAVLRGKLDYLKMVKGDMDSTYKKLQVLFDACITKEERKKTKKREKRKQSEDTHNPKKIVQLLSYFTLNNTALKYATHGWDSVTMFNGYSGFMTRISEEWKVVKKIKNYKPYLYNKISSFLFNDKLGEIGSRSTHWGKNEIEFGWSSKALKEWCKSGNDPFRYQLEKRFVKKVKNKKLFNFSDIVDVFKNEIELRENALKSIFLDLKRAYLKFDFNVNYIDIEGLEFYTDVQWLEKGLIKIFEGIRGRTEHKNVEICGTRDIKNEWIEIRIVHIDSISLKLSEEMKTEIDTGDFGDIRDCFLSLCDWSVEAQFEDGNYRINYLTSDDLEIKEKLPTPPDGFTHVLKFYR